jgi:hypothetical protein
MLQLGLAAVPSLIRAVGWLSSGRSAERTLGLIPSVYPS